MFRITAEYNDQLEVGANLEKVREFFSNVRNFVELMPGVESITADAEGIRKWLIRADVPLLGAMRAAFAVQQTVNLPERIEWSPAANERKNLLRYVATFEERAGRTLIRIVQRVEMRREHAKELHALAAWVGERRISQEMQKGITQMMRSFLQNARSRLER